MHAYTYRLMYACLYTYSSVCIHVAYIHTYIHTYMYDNHIILTLRSMASHDQKSHVAPHFYDLHLRNSVVPLMMPSVSCDADTGTNGGKCPQKSHVAPNFYFLCLINAMEPLMTLSSSFEC